MIPLPERGVFAALWTPTDVDGRLLEPELQRHLAFLEGAGVAGILALGSTGEFVHFSEAQRATLLERIGPMAAPLPVLANVSDVSPAVAGRLARVAKSAGCGAIAVLPPWYFPLEQADQLEFFLRVADATDLPVFLYNFPERTGNRIALETIAAFAQRARLAGVKQSGGEWDYHRDLIALGRAKGFGVFTGSDTRFAEALGLGCAGCISGLANFVPEPLVRVLAAHANGQAADTETDFLRRVGEACGRIKFPLDVAAGMQARGFVTGPFKSAVSQPTKAKYELCAGELAALLTGAGLA
ncbi:MAG TPA: dihydrodipicolinate synthase family protein [Candidatus Limnocylindria bacterium]|jgi:4-hydroxy-tetrahydrodipicolinate synthase|nr:dihydrodipicolinate synthase family protein [Candidatus Limnocylindria bacterium]